MDKFPATLLNGQLLRKTLKHTHILFNNSCLQAIIMLLTFVLCFFVEVCGTKSFIARSDTPTSAAVAVGKATAKTHENRSVQTVCEGCHFGTCCLRL